MIFDILALLGRDERAVGMKQTLIETMKPSMLAELIGDILDADKTADSDEQVQELWLALVAHRGEVEGLRNVIKHFR